MNYKAYLLGFSLLFLSITLHPSTIKAPTSRSLMTFNIRRDGPEKEESRKWANRKHVVTELLNSTQPAIFALQEVTPGQLKDIKQALPHNYFFFGQSRGSSWFGLGKNEFNPIAYNKHKLKLIKHSTFKLNDNPFWFFNVKKSGWLPRICTWGLFEDKKTQQRFYVYNTHLDHYYPEARLYGLQIIMQRIANHKDSYPVFLMGDFNANVLEVEELNALLKEHSFVHTKQKASVHKGPEMTMHHWHDGDEEYIDHILVKHPEKWLITEHEVIQEDAKDPYPSDHRPVIVTIKN